MRRPRPGRSILVLIVALVATGCDTRTAEPDPFAPVTGPRGGVAEAPPARQLRVCPVDGAQFAAGTGVVVDGPEAGSRVELCSRGCSVRFAAEPARFAGAPDTRR